MMQKTDDDIFVACCDECFDEIDFRGRWNDFQGFIKSEGWHIRGSKNRGEMVEHICPACWEERTANDHDTHSR